MAKSGQGKIEFMLCLLGSLAYTQSELSPFWRSTSFVSMLTKQPWHSVVNSKELESVLNSSEGGFAVVLVENGTKWLQAGGDINTFLPIVMDPGSVAATSDLTLESALQQMFTTNTTGLYMRFRSAGVLHPTLSLLLRNFPEEGFPFPILVEVNVLETSLNSPQYHVDGIEFLTEISKIPGVVPVLGWTTNHGMDKVWTRLEQDHILKPFQAVRVKKMVEDLFTDPKSVRDQDVRFLELLLRKLDRTHSTTFTALALNQLLSAIRTNGHHKLQFQADALAPRQPSESRRARDPIREILPEYYVSDSEYSKRNVASMITLLEQARKTLAKLMEAGLGFAVRAGPAANLDSVNNLFQLVDGPEAAQRFFVVNAETTDREGRGDVKRLVETLGSDRVVLNLPPERENHSRIQRVPQPREEGGSGGPISKNCNIINIIAIALLKVFFDLYLQ